MRSRAGIGLVAILALCAVTAQPAVAGTAVDIELALLVDVSGSINEVEFNQQINGYVNAFKDSDVISAIGDGAKGSIAVSMYFWANNADTNFTDYVYQVVGWTEVNSAATGLTFANLIDDELVLNPSSGDINPYGGSTPIQGAMNTLAVDGSGLVGFADNTFDGVNIVDVSGDGSNNVAIPTGKSTDFGRDALVDAGVYQINGLVIGSSSIVDYYEDYVITSNTSTTKAGFVQNISSFNDFSSAIKSKLIREIGGVVPLPAAAWLGLGMLGGLGVIRKVRRKKHV